MIKLMINSVLGMIPKGWTINTLDDLAEIVGGATPSKKKDEYYCSHGISWITPKDLSRNRNKFIDRGKLDISELGFKNSSTRILPKGTVLFSSRAPIGYIAIAKNDVTTNQGFKSLIPKNDNSTEFIFYLLKHLTPVIEMRSSGSTFKEISAKGMKTIQYIHPTSAVLNEFHKIVASMSNMIQILEEESDRLVEMRDTLLPNLISGQVRILR